MYRKVKHFLCGCMAVLLILSCTGHTSTTITSIGNTDIEFADLLSIEDLGHNASFCSIRDPWGTERIVMSYLLIPEEDQYWDEAAINQIAQQQSEAIILRTPLKRMAVTSACHAWLLLQLDAQASVAILCDTSYVISADVRQWMRSTDQNGHSIVADGGTSASPNKEVLISQECDGLWISPYENIGIGNISSIHIPIIYCSDYMETTPLGRAEWMRFYGRLVNKGNQADSLFNVIARNYTNLVTEEADGKKLLCELPYGATWYVPGGSSTAARLYKDAGFDYLWSKDCHAGSLSLSKEAVLAKAQDCDIWLIKYNDPNKDWTIEDLGKQDAMYRHFKAYTENEVYGCNTSTSDFFDVTPFRPDSLLQSLKVMDGVFFRQLK